MRGSFPLIGDRTVSSVAQLAQGCKATFRAAQRQLPIRRTAGAIGEQHEACFTIAKMAELSEKEKPIWLTENLP